MTCTDYPPRRLAVRGEQRRPGTGERRPLLGCAARLVSTGTRKAMTATEARSVTFETTVTATGNNTGIVVPDALVADLGAGKRPPVLVDVNGYRYRSTVGVMGGKHMISISAAVRKDTGLSGGDPIRV